MKLALVMNDSYYNSEFAISENNRVQKGSILKVVEKLSDTEKAKQGWWITTKEVLEDWIPNDGSIEVYSSEPFKVLYLVKLSDGSWQRITQNEEEAFRSLGKETKIMYKGENYGT